MDAVAKAEHAYGPDNLRKMTGVLNLLVNRKEIRHADDVLDLDYDRTVEVVEALRQSARETWPDSEIREDLEAGNGKSLSH